MQKITAADAGTKSPDLVADNLAKLKALFPELVTEGNDGVAVNLDVLKQLVGDRTITDAEEKYGLNWHGKRRARQLALTPSTGTLRPCPEDNRLKTLKLAIRGLDVPETDFGNISKAPQLGVLDFRAFLNLAMVMTESERADEADRSRRCHGGRRPGIFSKHAPRRN